LGAFTKSSSFNSQDQMDGNIPGKEKTVNWTILSLNEVLLWHNDILGFRNRIGTISIHSKLFDCM
jgi:hypothetical protein